MFRNSTPYAALFFLSVDSVACQMRWSAAGFWRLAASSAEGAAPLAAGTAAESACAGGALWAASAATATPAGADAPDSTGADPCALAGKEGSGMCEAGDACAAGDSPPARARSGCPARALSCAPREAAPGAPEAAAPASAERPARASADDAPCGPTGIAGWARLAAADTTCATAEWPLSSASMRSARASSVRSESGRTMRVSVISNDRRGFVDVLSSAERSPSTPSSRESLSGPNHCISWASSRRVASLTSSATSAPASVSTYMLRTCSARSRTNCARSAPVST